MALQVIPVLSSHRKPNTSFSKSVTSTSELELYRFYSSFLHHVSRLRSVHVLPDGGSLHALSHQVRNHVAAFISNLPFKGLCWRKTDSLHRKIKASQATLLLINLFVAMFSLNLSFLVNESIAGLGNFAACVAIAAVMHYTMLATFTWFFIQALHLYFNLWKISTEIKHYMTKICITGWGKTAEPEQNNHMCLNS